MTAQHCQDFDLIDPPAGRRLSICPGCCKRIIECDLCDAMTVAGDVDGWVRHWTITSRDYLTREGTTKTTETLTTCPACSRRA